MPAANRVAVAMSGGVDSAVALLKVVEAGLEPVGVTLRLWIDPAAPDSERACCSPQSVRAARAACHALGVAHVGLDLRQEFRRVVVDEFVAEYGAGRTPNPCVRCNGSFRFDALASFADRIGAGLLNEPASWQGLPKASAAVIVSNDAANVIAARRGRGAVSVVPVTANVTHVYPFQVFLAAPATGLPRDLKAQTEQVRSLAVERIGEVVGFVPGPAMDQLEEALRLHLAL